MNRRSVVMGSSIRSDNGMQDKFAICPSRVTDNGSLWMAGAGGFEPPNAGTKILCLTA